MAKTDKPAPDAPDAPDAPELTDDEIAAIAAEDDAHAELIAENAELRAENAALRAAVTSAEPDDNRARFRLSEGARLDAIEQERIARLADSNITRNALKLGE
jgi:hypothetical protein